MPPTDISDLAARLPPSLYAEIFRAAPVGFLVLKVAGLTIVEANAAYLTDIGMAREDILGRHIFDVFPDSPLRDSDQSLRWRSLLERTVETGETQVVKGLRYDIPGEDGFERRWWNLAVVPIPDEAGEADLLLEFVENVTELSHARESLVTSQETSARAGDKMASLTEVALALTAIETLVELEEVILGRGVRVLGADGGAIVSRAPDGGWVVTTARYGDTVQVQYGWQRYEDPLPGATAGRTGQAIWLPTVESGLAYSDSMHDVYEQTGRLAWAHLPLSIGGQTLGALAVSWVEEHEFTEDDIDFLEVLAAQCAQTLSRIEVATAQRRTTQRVQDLAESLQSAMLTAPPRTDQLEIAVRYHSAVDVAQVGGDWYDAFLQPDGATSLVIGDVVGHDNVAAGKMGQLRGLLRALAYDAEDNPHGFTPSAILTRFEYAARGLEVDELATAVLARIEPIEDARGRRLRLSWSNAGNPPPIVLHPDGTTRLLDPTPDLLLGVDPGTERHDHQTDLDVGCTLLLYTDGLVERRGTSIDEGIADLRTALTDLADRPLEVLCDALLRRLTASLGEDDVALIAVRGATS